MKRILIFSLNYYPFVGGAEVAIKKITDGIPDIDFHLIAYRFDSALPKQERIGNVTVHRVGIGKRGMTLSESFTPIVYLGKVLYVPLAALKALRLNRKLHFDGAWSMMLYMTFPLVLMRFLRVRLPYLLTIQEGDPFERVFKRRRIQAFAPLLYYGIRHAARVQAISSFLLAWARRAGFAGEGEVVPNGVDLAHFSQTFPQEDLAYVKERLGKGPKEVFLVTTSRLVHKNGVDTVIDALPDLPKYVKFVVCGEGPLERALKARIEMLKISERVIFLGSVPHEELPLVLAACDIFIRPSRSEGMGNSFIEAMAAGLPVIATQVGGITDFLFDPDRDPEKEPTGYAVDTNAPNQIAATVKRILKNHEERERVVRNAKQAAEAYDWDRIALRMRSLFESVSKALPRLPRITLATPLPPEGLGGPAQYAKEVRRVLRERGFEAPLVSYGSLERKLPLGVRHLLYFARLLPKAWGAEAVIAFDTWSVGIPALLAARVVRAPLAIRIGGDFLWESYVERTGTLLRLSDFYREPRSLSLKERIIYQGTRYLLQRADALLFTTRWQRDLWHEAYGFAKERASIVENYYPHTKTFHEPVGKTFVSVGRKRVLKNAARVEEAFKKAKEVVPDLALDTRVLPPQEHHERLAQCYAVVVGSVSEVNPNTAIDALGHGKPCIVPKDSGAAERLEGIGIVVDTLDTEAMTKAFLELAQPQAYREAVERIRAFTYSHSWEVITDEILASVKIHARP